MAKPVILKPNYTSFVLFTFAKGVLSTLFLFLVAGSILFAYQPALSLGLLGVLVLFNIFSFYSLTVRYQKEEYHFYPQRLVQKSGGIFSDATQELVLRNVTQVSMNLPFIEHKLFRTGHVVIESAGSGSSEILMSSIDKSHEWTDYVEKLLQRNGFKLKKNVLVQEEQPSTPAIMLELALGTIGLIVGAIFFVGTSVITFLFAQPRLLPFVFLGLFVLLVGLFLRNIFHFLDQKRRTYRLYKDTIVYTEGFLSKHYSFIPLENVADATIQQSLFERVLGVSNVTVSCQGSNQEIRFRNMPNGAELENNIDKLIKGMRSLVSKQQQQKTTSVAVKKSVAKTVIAPTGYTQELRMDGKRVFMPLLFAFPLCLLIFPLLPVWLFLMAFSFVRYSATRYRVKQASMEESFDFINKKVKEFSNDKITGIIFKQNPLDRWLKTYSVRFWSIGSSEQIEFHYLKHSSPLTAALLKKVGMTEKQLTYSLKSDFSASAMAKASLFFSLIILLFLVSVFFGVFVISGLFVLPLALLVGFVVVLVLYKKAYYARCQLATTKGTMSFKQGLIIQETFYVLQDNVKDVTTIQYPFSSLGSIVFNVAGESLVQQGKAMALLSNSFRINYVNDIDTKDEFFDILLATRPSAVKIKQIVANITKYVRKPLRESQPALANSVAPLITFCIIVPPLLPLLPFLLTFVIVYVRRIRYGIQPYRVYKQWGILWKMQKSVLLSKVDNIQHDQGALNKMFKNGNISVNTTGSSVSEMEIKALPDYMQFYEELKKRY